MITKNKKLKRKKKKKKRGERRKTRRRMSEGSCRRISLGVCPAGRGERAVTERDGVTKGGTRMRWNGTYTPRYMRKRGRIDTVPMETRRRLSLKTLGPSTSSRSLSLFL